MSDNKELITIEQAREFCDMRSGTRPRMYAMLADGSAIVAVRSNYDLDRYELGDVWLSNATVADLISRA